MATSQPVDEEELPNFSLGLEFLNPKKGANEKDASGQVTPNRFAALSVSEMQTILEEKHAARTKQLQTGRLTHSKVNNSTIKTFHFIYSRHRNSKHSKHRSVGHVNISEWRFITTFDQGKRLPLS